MTPRLVPALVAAALVAACGGSANSPTTTTSAPTTTSTTTTVAGTTTTTVAGSTGIGVGDPYYPGLGNPGYDVEHYDLAVTVADGLHEFSVALATITATATATLAEFHLDFIGFEVITVTVDGSPAEFTLEGNELVVTPSAGASVIPV